MPYVNIVDVDAVSRIQLKIFAIAGAQLTDEKTESYRCRPLTCNRLEPRKTPEIITMDFAAAALDAFEDVFP